MKSVQMVVAIALVLGGVGCTGVIGVEGESFDGDSKGDGLGARLDVGRYADEAVVPTAAMERGAIEPTDGTTNARFPMGAYIADPSLRTKQIDPSAAGVPDTREEGVEAPETPPVPETESERLVRQLRSLCEATTEQEFSCSYDYSTGPNDVNVPTRLDRRYCSLIAQNGSIGENVYGGRYSDATVTWSGSIEHFQFAAVRTSDSATFNIACDATSNVNVALSEVEHRVTRPAPAPTEAALFAAFQTECTSGHEPRFACVGQDFVGLGELEFVLHPDSCLLYSTDDRFVLTPHDGEWAGGDIVWAGTMNHFQSEYLDESGARRTLFDCWAE